MLRLITILMNSKDRWVVWMPCKHYVKKWLLANFNRPDDNWKEIVDLSPDNALQRSFRNHLSRGGRRNTVDYDMSRYNDSVAIEINHRIFNTFGWELTPYETYDFNCELEARVKMLLRTHVATMLAIGMSVGKAIDIFRVMTGIDEDDWSEDSIRKDISRNVPKENFPLISQIMLKMTENLFLIMTKSGQLTRQASQDYLDNLSAHSNL